MLVVDFFTLKLVICWSRVGQGQSSKKGGVHTLQYVYPLVPILLETFLLPSKTIYFWDLLVKDWSRHDFFEFVVRDWSRTQTRGKRKTLVKCWSRKMQNMFTITNNNTIIQHFKHFDPSIPRPGLMA